MNKPDGYDQATAYFDGASVDKPIPGAYICVIKHAFVDTLKGADFDRERLILNLDIAEGQFKDFFVNDYNRRIERGGIDFWACSIKQYFTGKAIGFFKGLIKNIEASNNGFHFDFDEHKLVGKLIGIVFDGRERKGNNGFTYLNLEPNHHYSVDQIKRGHFSPPVIFDIDGNKRPVDVAQKTFNTNHSSSSASDDDFPF